MADKTADAHQFLLRLPKPLHRRLVAQAKRNNVSLNTEIVNQLEGHEAEQVQQITDIMQPLLDEAVRTSAATAAGVAMVLSTFRPRTEDELLERLEQLDASNELVEMALAAFRASEAPKEPESK
jgi:HicB-like protein involved in pilus formation